MIDRSRPRIQTANLRFLRAVARVNSSVDAAALRLHVGSSDQTAISPLIKDQEMWSLKVQARTDATSVSYAS